MLFPLEKHNKNRINYINCICILHSLTQICNLTGISSVKLFFKGRREAGKLRGHSSTPLKTNNRINKCFTCSFCKITYKTFILV